MVLRLQKVFGQYILLLTEQARVPFPEVAFRGGYPGSPSQGLPAPNGSNLYPQKLPQGSSVQKAVSAPQGLPGCIYSSLQLGQLKHVEVR